MLSISNVSIEQAATYYQQDNYYTKERGEFFGKAIKNIGFTEELTHDNFINMLNGRDSNGNNLRREKETGKTRAGYDHTFTAPKSLSILLEMAEAKGDKTLSQTIRNLHDKAVNSTLTHIEDNYIQTRVRTGGDRIQVQTNNMIAAKFEHDTSRELDPTLHTHCVIANLTQREDGEWVSISNELLYENKMSNGLYYRSELALLLKQELGIDIEITNTKQGLFEIKDIDKTLIDEFSKRAEQIKEEVKKLKEQYPKMSTAELKQMATLNSRQSKKEVDREKIYQENLKRAETLIDVDNLLLNVSNKNQIIVEKQDLDNLIKQASEILTEQESVFTIEDVVMTATKINLGNIKSEELFEHIKNENSSLIKLDDNSYSTKEMIAIEQKIIREMWQGQRSVKPISKLDKVESYIEEKYSSMTKGQKESLSQILTTKDFIIGVQGDAGSGKTHMLQAVNQYLPKEHFEIVGLAFTGKAAGELEEQSGIKSTTLHSYLSKPIKPTEKTKIFLVDEASLVGSKQIDKLIEKAKAENGRVVLVGDTKQFASISAGGIFHQLQNHGMSTSNMSEALRQKTQILKDVVHQIKQSNTNLAFELLEKEGNALISETQDLVSDIFEAYKEQPDALIIASTNKVRNELNKKIRDFHNHENQTVFKIRETPSLNDVDKLFAQNYSEKQILSPNKNIPGLKVGNEYKITFIDIENQKLTVKGTKEDEKEIDIKKFGNFLSVYDITDKKFGINEKIMFTKNDKNYNVKNGETAIITNIDKDNITVNKDGKSIIIDTNKYNYFDYGYCTTDYKSQGATAEHVLIAANAQMATNNSFYVQITRAKQSVKIFTDDLELLKDKVTEKSKKSSTLEYLKEFTNELSNKLSELENIQGQTEEVDLLEIVNNIKLHKDEEVTNEFRQSITKRAIAGISEATNRINEAARVDIESINRNIRKIDNSTIEGTLFERDYRREPNSNTRDKGDMLEIIERMTANQSLIKTQIKAHEEFLESYINKSQSQSHSIAR